MALISAKGKEYLSYGCIFLLTLSSSVEYDLENENSGNGEIHGKNNLPKITIPVTQDMI